MGLRDFARSLVPGQDVALAAEIRQREEDRKKKQAAKEAADRRKRAAAHKRRLARKGSGADLI